MQIKEHEYVRQTLERYTDCKLGDICDHVLITNFKKYILRFQEKTQGKYSEGNFRIVNANTALVPCAKSDICPAAELYILQIVAYGNLMKTL
jgi:hypothetical protein